MPNLLTNKFKRIKKYSRKTKRLTFMFVFAFLILFCLLIISLADVFSTTITHKGSLFIRSKLETTSYSIYGVSLKHFESNEQATIYAEKAKESGAAGFVYVSGEHFVLANAYPTLNEAKEIEQNLKSLGYNSKVVNINVQALSLNYRGNDKSKIETSIGYFRNCYNTLYEECLNLDKGLSQEHQTKSEIAKLITLVTNLMQNLNISNKQILTELKTSLKQSKSILEDLLYTTTSNLIFSSKIKSASISIVLENKQLINKLNLM